MISETTPSVQRQDSLTDQMGDVMRYAVESGCYDAHNWLVDVWGARHGICGDEVSTMVGPGRKVFCVLTHGHSGAHEDDSRPPMHWWSTADNQHPDPATSPPKDAP